MLVETGRVVAVDPDGVWVETIRQSTCGSCAAQQGCGHSLLNRISDGKRSYIRVLSGAQNCEQCRVDDQVRISTPGMGDFFAFSGSGLGIGDIAGVSPMTTAIISEVGRMSALIRMHFIRCRK